MNGSELLAQYRKTGSEAAFIALLRQYSGLVYAAARRHLSNLSLAEDVTQVVFTRLAKNPPAITTDGQFAGWLHRTTVHVAVDVWRAESRRQNREQQAVLMQTTSADDAKLWEELTPHLDEALDQLNDTDRQAVLLRYFEGKSMREVGAGLGVTEDAAKVRVGRALSRLRDQLVRRGVTCTVVLLAGVLSKHAVEAAPAQLVARLIGLNLAVPVATAGIGAGILQLAKSKVVIASTVLTFVLVYFAVMRSTHLPEVSVADVTASPVVPAESPTNEARPVLRSMAVTPPAIPDSRTRFMLRVVNREDGRGLPDAKIRIAYFYAGGEGEGHESTTEPDGLAPIPKPDRANTTPIANIFVSVWGYVPKCMRVGESDDSTEKTLELDPATTLSGVVTDEEGHPVAGVELKANRDDRIDRYDNDKPTTDFQTSKVTTDENGRWTFPFAPRTYEEIYFNLVRDDYVATTAIVPIGATEDRNVHLVISRGFVVEGRVTDAQGNPVVNASVEEFHQYNRRRVTTQTDAEGNFQLRGLGRVTFTPDRGGFVPGKTPPEDLTRKGKLSVVKPKEQHVELVVQAKGFAPAVRIVQLVTPTNQMDFVLRPAAIFRGHIVDEQGHPISNAVVRTDMDFKNQIEDRFGWFTHATKDGRFEWGSAPPETLCFWFEADGYEIIRSTPMLPDGTDHEIVLRRKSQ